MNNCTIIENKVDFFIIRNTVITFKNATELRIKMNELSRFLVFVILIFH